MLVYLNVYWLEAIKPENNHSFYADCFQIFERKPYPYIAFPSRYSKNREPNGIDWFAMSEMRCSIIVYFNLGTSSENYCAEYLQTPFIKRPVRILEYYFTARNDQRKYFNHNPMWTSHSMCAEPTNLMFNAGTYSCFRSRPTSRKEECASGWSKLLLNKILYIYSPLRIVAVLHKIVQHCSILHINQIRCYPLWNYRDNTLPSLHILFPQLKGNGSSIGR